MTERWWKEAVVYQIYPRSFMDANGDGIGDINGIISKLDYLKALGVDTIWLSPVYKSPNEDNGYDISDYRDIMDEFGTLEDFKRLLKEAHNLGIRLVMDLVVNHTSDEHPWFVQSRASKDNPYSDYYIWREGKNGGPPSNMESIFGGSAWEYDKARGQYYLHLFAKKQPDLNWENPSVRRDIYDMMRYWLDMGVDGFRMDTVNMYSKVQSFPDVRPTGLIEAADIYLNGPRIHEFLQEMNRECLKGNDIMTVGEAFGTSPEEALLFTGESRNELNMIFQFEHTTIDWGQDKWESVRYEPAKLKDVLIKWQYALENEGWNSQFLSNHDSPRQVSRFGNDREYRVQSAKMLATLIHTLKGTPFIYQGEELGMANPAFDSAEDYRDIETLNMIRDRMRNRDSLKSIMDAAKRISRDNSRTPMQWTDEKNAGFTTGEPWIKPNPDYTEVNAKAQIHDPDSVFSYYKRLIALRREHKAISYGSFTALEAGDENIFAFVREYEGEKLIIILNMSSRSIPAALPKEAGLGHCELLAANYTGTPETMKSLRPYEAIVLKQAN